MSDDSNNRMLRREQKGSSSGEEYKSEYISAREAMRRVLALKKSALERNREASSSEVELTPRSYAEHLLGRPFSEEEVQQRLERIKRRQAVRSSRSKTPPSSKT